MANQKIQHSPSLRSQYDWFLVQAENEDNPPEDRALWRRLADEVNHFVTEATPVFSGVDHGDRQQQPLF